MVSEHEEWSRSLDRTTIECCACMHLWGVQRFATCNRRSNTSPDNVETCPCTGNHRGKVEGCAKVWCGLPKGGTLPPQASPQILVLQRFSNYVSWFVTSSSIMPATVTTQFRVVTIYCLGRKCLARQSCACAKGLRFEDLANNCYARIVHMLMTQLYVVSTSHVDQLVALDCSGSCGRVN